VRHKSVLHVRAARVEATTRETGDDVLITEATRERMWRSLFEFEERPPVRLKGKSVQVQSWAPRSGAAPKPVPD
jgi:adenylate cyclase